MYRFFLHSFYSLYSCRITSIHPILSLFLVCVFFFSSIVICFFSRCVRAKHGFITWSSADAFYSLCNVIQLEVSQRLVCHLISMARKNDKHDSHKKKKKKRKNTPAQKTLKNRTKNKTKTLPFISQCYIFFFWMVLKRRCRMVLCCHWKNGDNFLFVRCFSFRNVCPKQFNFAEPGGCAR